MRLVWGESVAFSSLSFLLYFLPIFFIVYALAPRAGRTIVLLAGSLLFYALGDVSHLLLLVCSVIINYGILQLVLPGSTSQGPKKGKIRGIFLGAGILLNVAVLLWFKFFSGSLPLGISFYTFQVLSCLIDGWRGEIGEPVPFLSFCVYITMFPKLGSGPIAEYPALAGEIRAGRLKARNIEEGLKLFTAGLAAKVLLADRFSPLWQQAQTIGYESLSVPMAWLCAVGFSLNLYFDFCGYSLMAVGLGRMLGFHLPENFHDPYMATSVREFYRRWHMSLGAWFKKYIYIPLGGNRRGEGRTVLNLLVVWLLTGLWHGVTFNFLLWGLMLWVFITLERQVGRIARYVKKRRENAGRKDLSRNVPLAVLKTALSHVYLLVVIVVSWVCFAVTKPALLGTYLGRMFGVVPGINVNSSDWLRQMGNYWWLLIVGILACTPLARKLYAVLKDRFLGKVILALLFWACVLRVITAGDNPFLYFNF